MSRATTVYVIRHGQSEWNNQSRICGQADPGLTAKGLAQSEALARALAGERLHAIYVSALWRAVQTATPCARAQGLVLQSLPALNEIHMGALQGRYRDARDAEAACEFQRWREDMWNYRVPGGESFAELAERAGAALRDILRWHEGGSVLIVAHRGTNRVLLGNLLQLPRADWPALRPSSKLLQRIVLRDARLHEHTELELKWRAQPHYQQQASAHV